VCTLKELFDISGRIALVTGSGGGLGLVMARGLASYGAKHNIQVNAECVEGALTKSKFNRMNSHIDGKDCDAEKVSLGDKFNEGRTSDEEEWIPD